jgi:cytokinin riboside 5'-monophosphate phosphoribohydrolase
MKPRRVTVFCSSSGEIDPLYLKSAADLGAAIAREGWQLVYGGNSLGSMRALADACRAAGGHVIGVTPQLFADKGFTDNACHELIVTPDMRSRKAKMEELGDAFIAMPGGFGTLEELSEIMVGRMLKYHAKPVILYNVAGFYSPLVEFFEKMIHEHFARTSARTNYFVAPTVDVIVDYLKQHWGR